MIEKKGGLKRDEISLPLFLSSLTVFILTLLFVNRSTCTSHPHLFRLLLAWWLLLYTCFCSSYYMRLPVDKVRIIYSTIKRRFDFFPSQNLSSFFHIIIRRTHLPNYVRTHAYTHSLLNFF